MTIEQAYKAFSECREQQGERRWLVGHNPCPHTDGQQS